LSTSGVGFQLWAQWVDAPDLLLVSLGLFVLGVGFLLGGRPLARLLAAPLGILVLAIPFPGAFHNFVVYHLQLASAALADAGLRGLGFDVVLQSDILSIGSRKFEVIESCSGLLAPDADAARGRVGRLRCPPGTPSARLGAPIAFVTNGIRVMVIVLDRRGQESHARRGPSSWSARCFQPGRPALLRLLAGGDRVPGRARTPGGARARCTAMALAR
jgi:hypothetical protein